MFIWVYANLGLTEDGFRASFHFQAKDLSCIRPGVNHYTTEPLNTVSIAQRFYQRLQNAFKETLHRDHSNENDQLRFSRKVLNVYL